MSGDFKGRVLRTCGGKNNGLEEVTAVCLSTGDELVISCHKEKIFIHKLSSLEQVGKLEGHRTDITCCSAAHDLLVTGSQNGIVHLWKFRDLKRVARIGLPAGPIKSVALSKSSFSLAVAYANAKTRIYSLYSNDGTMVQGPKYTELAGHSGGVTDLKFSEHNENTLISSSNDGTIRMWDVASGKCRLVMEPGLGPILTVAYSGGSNIAFLTENNGMQVWSIDTNESLWGVNKSFQYLGASNFSQGLALVNDTNSLMCYNVALQKETVKKGTAHEGAITACVVTSSGRNFITAATDGKLFVWE